MEAMFGSMNTKQEQRLDELIGAIVSRFRPLQIVCFGSTIQTNAIFNCFSEPKELDKCDYDLLTIIDTDHSGGDDIQKFTDNQYQGGQITILQATTEAVTTAIKHKDVYIITILEKGAVLFTAEGFDSGIERDR